MILNTQGVTSLVDLLIVGDHPHILDKTMDNLKGCAAVNFVSSWVSQFSLLDNCLDVFLSEQLLDKFLVSRRIK